MAFDDPDVREGSLDAAARDWVVRLSSGRATTGDARRLQQWCERSAAHQAAFARAREQWHAVDKVADVYRRMHPESGRSAAARPARRRFFATALSATGAAAVAMAFPPFGLWPSWSELGADYRTTTGEQRRVALDGRIALTLNTQTSLAVRAEAASTRISLIAGEAEVRRDDGALPVEVVAGEGRIVPGLGSIEVRRADERYCVTCVEGRAELTHPVRGVTLRAGEQVWYGADDVSAVTDFDRERTLAWRQGVVAFHDTPLAEAIAEINRYRPGRVMLMNDALTRRRLSGYFQVGSLDEAITQIEQLFGAHARRLPGGVLLLS